MSSFKVAYTIIIVTYLAFLMVSCNNPNAPDCFQSAGTLKTIAIHDFPAFNELIVHDNISLIITEDDTTYFELSFYENLIPEIIYSLEQESLVFRNNNSCNFVRDYKSPTLIYHSSKDFNRIIGKSIGEINNIDTLKNDISISTEDVSNIIILSTANSHTTLASNSNSNFKLRGSTKNLRIAAYFNDGKFDCSDLNSDRANVLQRGYNDITVNVSDSLIGSIENSGKIIYYGNPGIKMTIFGGGKLIKATQ